MALIKTTAIVDAISGKIQGTVFARNKGGAYARGRGVVTNPRSAAQMRVRSMFGAVSASWRSLSPEQIAGWNALASETTYQNRLGDTRHYTGKALFQKINQNRLLQAEDILKNAPEFGELVGVVSATGSMSVTGSDLSINFNAILADMLPADPSSGFALSATPPLRPSTNYVKNMLRGLDLKVGLTGNSVDETDFAADADALGALYASKFGLPKANEKIVLALRPINENGQKGTEFVFEVNFQ